MINGSCTVTFKEPTITRDDGGAEVKSYSAITGLDGVSVIVDPISTEKRVLHEKVGEKVSHRVIMDYTTGITTACIMTWDGKDYRILHIRNPNNINHHLELDIYENG